MKPDLSVRRMTTQLKEALDGMTDVERRVAIVSLPEAAGPLAPLLHALVAEVRLDQDLEDKARRCAAKETS